MARWKLYIRLAWLFFISLFVPTTTMTKRVEALLAELGESPASGRDA
ncbi:MAG: hypothetical protein VKS61_08000 [Candidatus Sericytochromatia bacterium]|jgi:hypothetical protein|nr:hypothetical protein [Candidatus Sericytochromatia bacterium]